MMCSSPTSEELLDILSNIVRIDPGVASTIQAEELTVQTFKLLTEHDLEALGFKMGSRKMLLQWIESQKQPNSSAEVSLTVPEPTTPIPSTSATTTSDSIGKSASSSGGQEYDVVSILSNITRGKYIGTDLVQKLQADIIYTQEERKFMVKTLGKYLMKNAKQQDCPTKTEKAAMAKAIVSAFPVLMSRTPLGHEVFFDPKCYTGHLEWYIRCKRSRDVTISVTPRRKRKANRPLFDQDEELNDVEVRLRQTKPTSTNAEDIMKDMTLTRQLRRLWIDDNKPTATAILRRWPRLGDVPATVTADFEYINTRTHSLTDKWPAIQPKLLKIVSDKAAAGVGAMQLLTAKIADDYDEEGKMLVSIMCLPYLLTVPPKKGVKAAKPGAERVMRMLLCDSEKSTIVEAIEVAKSESLLQPCLIKAGSDLAVKLDDQALLLETSSLIEAVDFLFQIFFVFGLEYPWYLRAVYGFFEELCGMKVSVARFSSLVALTKALEL